MKLKQPRAFIRPPPACTPVDIHTYMNTYIIFGLSNGKDWLWCWCCSSAWNACTCWVFVQCQSNQWNVFRNREGQDFVAFRLHFLLISSSSFSMANRPKQQQHRRQQRKKKRMSKIAYRRKRWCFVGWPTGGPGDDERRENDIWCIWHCALSIFSFYRFECLSTIFSLLFCFRPFYSIDPNLIETLSFLYSIYRPNIFPQ